MKCYVVDGQGIENLKIVERDSPKLKNTTDVLVSVKACSLNYRDLLVAKGLYGTKQFPDFIPLSDMSGIVTQIGEDVQELKIGDRVLNAPFKHWPAGPLRAEWARTFVGGAGVDGVLAEQIVFPADALVKIPDYLDMLEASTLTIAGLTAWSSVVTHGQTKPGEWVLLHGTGGVSLFAAQLARAMGARVVLTTSHPEKGNLFKEKFGIEAFFDYRDPDWPKKVKAFTKTGVDVVVDVAGGETLSRSLKACNYGARVAQVGILSGSEATLKSMDLIHHQVTLRGIYMESTEQLRAFIQAMEALRIHPHVDQSFAFDQAKEAYFYLEAQKHIGKVVITL